MADPAQTRLERAERIARVAHEIGIDTALIGAAALAAHGFVRATLDLDLGCDTDLAKLRALQQRLEAMHMHTELRTPDDQDDLGGVLEVWEETDEDGDPVSAIELVNFTNPYRPDRRAPGRNAVRNAQPVAPGSALRYVQLPDLIALKLAAGGRRDRQDVIDVLARNPDADLDVIRAACKPYGFEETLEELIAASRSE